MTEQIFKPKVYRELKMGWPLLVLFFLAIHYLQYNWIFALINLMVMVFVFFVSIWRVYFMLKLIVRVSSAMLLINGWVFWALGGSLICPTAKYIVLN